MKQKITSFLVTLGLVSGLGVAVAMPAAAINVYKGCDGQTSTICKDGTQENVNPLIQTVIGTLIFAIGIISTIMIIVGGIRYVLSNGDAARVKSAKDTVLYAVVGLVLSLLAYAIVNFVVTQFA